jgi:hypothetical protein
MMRAGNHVGDDFGFSRIWDRRLENTDDGGGSSTEANVLAEDIGIGLECLSKVIGEDRSACGRTIVAHVQQSTQHRMEPQQKYVRWRRRGFPEAR